MMATADAAGMGAFARKWALALTRQESVTGSAGEQAFGPWLAQALSSEAAFAGARIWTEPVAPGDGRHCVFMLLRAGEDKNPSEPVRTVILTGHYDTVSLADYGSLMALATDPETLTPALAGQLQSAAATVAEKRALTDFATGRYLAGRGLLDMKSGLAAGLAAAAAFAASASVGAVLFLAVPDEEASSDGARAAAPLLSTIAAIHGLDLAGAINLDAIADDGDGSSGRVVALGTIGKLLLTAFVAGHATHAGFPEAGINAAAIAGAIAARMEWAPELTDTAEAPGTPPSLLMVRDGKGAYDVTTPGTAFVAVNVLMTHRTSAETLAAFEALVRDAAHGVFAALRSRAANFRTASRFVEDAAGIAVLRLEDVARHAAERDSKATEATLAASMAGTSLPDRCRLATENLWKASGLKAPAVVVGFGSIPYLPTRLSATPQGLRLESAARAAAAEAARTSGGSVTVIPIFAGISDMSFLGEANEAALTLVARNTPLWGKAFHWPAKRAIAGVPIVNAGPWGRDYHTRLERLETDYGFEVLPGLIAGIIARVLA